MVQLISVAPCRGRTAGTQNPCHQLVGSGIRRPVIYRYSSRKFPAADSCATTANPRIEVQVTE
eukprot:COSAG01_NODE_48612_length_379_cov_1.421429_1_plen_62_part_10